VFDPDVAAPSTPTIENDGPRPKRGGSVSKSQPPTNVVEKLESVGLKCVEWTGKCEADKVSTGKYDVTEGQGGMYGLVFDNTFSKQASKTATFVLMTHPTNAPPKSGSLSRFTQDHERNPASNSPSLRADSQSTESLPTDGHGAVPSLRLPKDATLGRFGNNFYTGIMYKKRRKRNQGYARRFFSLDFTSSTLSYYRNNHSSALRGSVPLSLAAMGVNEKNREFSIDSGAEVWHLRLKNNKDFEGWRAALEKASNSPIAAPSPAAMPGFTLAPPFPFGIDYAAEHEWARVEELVGRVSGSRDAVRRLAQDTDPKYGSATNGHAAGTNGSPTSTEENSYFMDAEGRSSERLPFWKRKPSSSSQGGASSGLFKRSISLAAPSPTGGAGLSPPLPPIRRKASVPQGLNDDVHERCMALLRDLDATVSEFSSLIASSKSRRRPPMPHSTSRMSLESERDQDFYDAEDRLEQSPSQMLLIDPSEDSGDNKEDEFVSDDESITSSDGGHRAPSVVPPPSQAEAQDSGVFPAKVTPAIPKDIPAVKFRNTVPPPKQPPPSIIGFLRKNAGKDLSTVSMPVSANEPTSLLQRLAEPLEAASLLSAATSSSNLSPAQSVERLMYVAAFAVAGFASNRVKERAIRKPFNPMLGETFELVRPEDPSSPKSPYYRFISEKVSHHPVIMAWQADSLSNSWSLSQSPRPVQKFWGKSVEFNTEGKWRLVLRLSPSESEERYSWTQAPAFLRNVLAGEKYVEPVQTMTITNETTGHKAVASFKAAGMFSGRSEDVSIAFYEPNSQTPLPLSLSGKWTSGLSRSDTGATVWQSGPLVADAAKVYGFPVFSVGLNELTAVEKGRIPPTDSRLRPDQKALEEGLLDKAEAVKARLEERQRARRKVLESHGREYKARFFELVEGAEEEMVWRLKSGREGYWECRERGDWSGVDEVFEV